MQPVLEPGKYADLDRAATTGIDSRPGDFEYVKVHD